MKGEKPHRLPSKSPCGFKVRGLKKRAGLDQKVASANEEHLPGWKTAMLKTISHASNRNTRGRSGKEGGEFEKRRAIRIRAARSTLYATAEGSGGFGPWGGKENSSAADNSLTKKALARLRQSKGGKGEPEGGETSEGRKTAYFITERSTKKGPSLYFSAFSLRPGKGRENTPEIGQAQGRSRSILFNWEGLFSMRLKRQLSTGSLIDRERE